MKRKILALLAGVMVMAASSALAVPITGEINFTGDLQLVGGTNLTSATGIDFVAGTTAVAATVSGTYASIPTPPPLGNVTAATFTNFTYNAASNPILASTVTNLWQVIYGGSTYSFDMTGITLVTATELAGAGVLHATGYDNTLGNFELTTQAGETSGNLSFSATSAVPEPGTMVLLGAGMLGLAVYGKRRMNKEA